MALRDLRRTESSYAAYVAAAEAAQKLGWTRMQQAALRPLAHRCLRWLKPFYAESKITKMRRALSTERAVVLYGEVLGRTIALCVSSSVRHSWVVGKSSKVEELAKIAAQPESLAFPRALTELRGRLACRLPGERPRNLSVVPTIHTSSIPFACVWPSRTITTHLYYTAVADGRFKPRRGRDVLAICSTAPKDRHAREVEKLGDTLLVGSMANRVAIQAAFASRPRWMAIHLACSPLRTKLLGLPAFDLWGDESEEDHDGPLVLEKGLTHFPCYIVVLAGPWAAKLRAPTVATWVGACLDIGGDYVLAQLWPSDSAGSLLRTFYGQLRKGASAPEALRDAQRAAMRGSPDAIGWAGWQLWGRGIEDGRE